MSPAPLTERVVVVGRARGGRGGGGEPRPLCTMAMRYLGKGRTLVTSMMAQMDSDLKEKESLKEDLKFYFMNPCEKYRARRQIPWKLGLQILKIVMVTTQLILFGLSNQLVVSFKEENTVAFKHLFLKNYSGVDEDDYSCSVYTQQDVSDSIFFAVTRYRQLKNISLGTLGYEQDEDGLQICKQQYRKGTMLPSNGTLNIDSTIETECIRLDPQELATKEISDLKNEEFFRLDFYRLIEVEISFKLKGIDLQTIRARELPDCYEFENTITFNNKAHSGKMKIFFDTDADIQECKDWNISGSIQKNTQYILVFDGFVIVSCFASLILCTRSIILALKLQKRFVNFFLENYKRHVCNSDRLEFINGWYVLVIISDVMTIIGSIMKMEIKAKNLTSYDVCSILLGTSTLFVWVGVIRYLGYFQTYNVLILTMQASLPKVLRFCCCAGMIYLGYTFCGWIVLGPYHEKFEDMNTVAECLFSLVNGDDMFATFAQIQRKSTLVWLFSRLYLYSFISLFIYMILSLFIALITDAYDTIKKYQQSGFPVTDLHEFLKECGDEEYSMRPQTSMSFCCCRRRKSDDNLVLVN
ncbi:mucolipin-2 isoform X2 [Hemicordylus capensis]|uniref:mucolipin-2 isoform X2 n=1 Tax=Hemicordylus capensis TaxID=884348 RepID=UPI002303908C|nr:mucolipin-2 isoform X2 [Hemicordylus capensis]